MNIFEIIAGCNRTCLFGIGFLLAVSQLEMKAETRRSNILFAISDDQSFNHTSFTGC
jgi:hypothetical protein